MTNKKEGEEGKKTKEEEKNLKKEDTDSQSLETHITANSGAPMNDK